MKFLRNDNESIRGPNEMVVKLIKIIMKYPNEIRNERVWTISLPLPILYERLQ